MIDIANLPDKAPEFDLRELYEAGVHFGHQSKKWHPKIAPFIYQSKDGIHIFDLAKTAEQLRIAYNHAYQLGAQGKTLLFVGTKRQAREAIKASATGAGAMYIVTRWLGGLLTNWEQVSKSLKRMLKLEKGLESGEFTGYTKYEQLQMQKELERLRRFFDGIRTLSGKPDCLFVIDPVREANVVKEAKVTGVDVIALIDSNGDPRTIDLAIPGNDDALSSVKYIVEAVAAGYAAGKQVKK